jgi:hypothetical protein
MYVALQERRFQEALALIESRSEMLVEDAHPKMEAAGLTDDTVNEATVRAAIGPVTAGRLVTLTSGLLNALERNLGEMPVLYHRLLTLLRKRLPGEYFPELDFGEWNPPAGKESAAT